MKYAKITCRGNMMNQKKRHLHNIFVYRSHPPGALLSAIGTDNPMLLNHRVAKSQKRLSD